MKVVQSFKHSRPINKNKGAPPNSRLNAQHGRGIPYKVFLKADGSHFWKKGGSRKPTSDNRRRRRGSGPLPIAARRRVVGRADPSTRMPGATTSTPPTSSAAHPSGPVPPGRAAPEARVTWTDGYETSEQDDAQLASDLR